MLTGIYVRVSTEEQATGGYSIRAQEEKLRDYAKVKDWIVYKIYIDEGISGKNITERPAVNEMIEDIKNKKVENVVVYKIDRLTRSIVDLIKFVDIFSAHNCCFNSLTESIDTQTAAGRMFLKIIGIFAEFERENIVERTKLGFERKAKEGYSLCTRVASYGYNRPSGNKIQQINGEEAKIVQRVFEMFVNEQKTCLAIATLLNMQGVVTKENSKWHARTIKNMLTNCNYIGNVRYSMKDEKRNFEAKGHHEPIIDEKLYSEAQELVSNIKVKICTKRPKEEHYFLGVLYCGVCGEKMSTHGSYYNGEYKGGSYRCRNRIKKTCLFPDIIHKKVETAFVEYIGTINDFDVDDVNINVDSSPVKTNADLIEEYKSKYIQLEKREKDLTQHYVNGDINFDDYISVKKEIDKSKKAIVIEIAELENNHEEDYNIQKADIIKNLQENWNVLTDKEKRQFLLKFVEKITVTQNCEEESGKRLVKIREVEFKRG